MKGVTPVHYIIFILALITLLYHSIYDRSIYQEIDNKYVDVYVKKSYADYIDTIHSGMIRGFLLGFLLGEGILTGIRNGAVFSVVNPIMMRLGY